MQSHIPFSYLDVWVSDVPRKGSFYLLIPDRRRLSPCIEDSLGRGKGIALQLPSFLKVRRVRRKVRDRSACELVDVRRPATRCIPQIVHTLHKPPCFLRQSRYRLPGFTPCLAVIVGIPPAVRGVPYRIEACQHRHGVQVCDRKPDLAKDDRQAGTEVRDTRKHSKILHRTCARMLPAIAEALKTLELMAARSSRVLFSCAIRHILIDGQSTEI